MSRAQIRCHTCGSRSELEVGEMEMQALRQRGYIFRSCRICRGSTRHDFHSESDGYEEVGSSLRQLDAEAATRGRVLVIDDDAEIRIILSKALGSAQFEVVTAGTGREAVSLLARDDFDAILSDIRMPELDGRKLFAFLEEHLPESKQRVVFITGDTSSEETMVFLGETGRPYLPKPVDIPMLLVLVEQVIASTSPPPSAA